MVQSKFEAHKTALWFFSFLLLLFPVYLGQFDLSGVPVLQYAIYASSLLAYGLLASKVYFLDGHSRKELLYITATLVLLALGVVFSGIRSLFSTGLLVIACRDVPFSKIAKCGFFFFAGAILINALLVLLGVLEDTTIIRGELIGQGNVRHTLGFGYPNTLALWGMVTVFGALLFSQKGFRVPLLALVFSVGLFLLTDSKAAFLSSLLAVVLFLAFRAAKNTLTKWAWAPAAAAALVALAAFGFIGLALLYREDSRAFALLNTLFSQRLGYANQGFQLFGASLFGAHVDFGWDPVDSLYAYGPICLGVVPSLLYLGFGVYAAYRGAKAGHWEIVAVALAGALYSTMEYSLINPIFVPIYAFSAALEAPTGEKKKNPSV